MRVICSGVLAVKLDDNGKNWEVWDHPSGRTRLLDLIERSTAEGVIFLNHPVPLADLPHDKPKRERRAGGNTVRLIFSVKIFSVQKRKKLSGFTTVKCSF